MLKIQAATMRVLIQPTDSILNLSLRLTCTYVQVLVFLLGFVFVTCPIYSGRLQFVAILLNR